ncbi:hypothetical protein E2C01_097374 [Portunus trituberculatus]|uniref:Uncharacterized protein n=1 Tax=Portunus trituberculatus TaxID=210409 RepID=A0A5B7K9S7_PORTR|nr:hypothetical protein [Portunus trituberculatus]
MDRPLRPRGVADHRLGLGCWEAALESSVPMSVRGAPGYTRLGRV